MSYASLGGMQFRVDPSQVHWEYSVDVAVTPTIGGRVVQVLGTTLGDMTIQGLYGEKRSGGAQESWQLAEDFATKISRLAERQAGRPTMAQLMGTDPSPMHPTMRFRYNDDTPERRARNEPIHDWDFNVYIKALRDVAAPNATVAHQTGKFSYGYTLTLFIAEDNTGQLDKVARNSFVDRLSNGLGWQRTPYNGHMTVADLEAYLNKNSPDGTIHGLVLDQFTKAAAGEVPGYGSALNPVPGGAGAVAAAGGNK